MTGFEIFAIVLFIGLAILFMYANYKCKKDEEDMIPETKKRLLDNNINENNIKSIVSFNDNDGCLIYTNDNKLKRIKHGFKKEDATIDVFNIDINQILDVKIDVHVQEKNCMRVIALVPTFDSSKKIVNINMTIITESNVISLNIGEGHTLFNTDKIFINNRKLNRNEKINELNRLKLLIEKNMKLSKQEM